MSARKYIVYITKYKGNKLPPWYIGSSYEGKVINGYNGSVKSKKYKEIFNKEQKEHKHLFRTKILSYHKTYQEALKEELRLQKMHKVVRNSKYFNESYAQENGYFGRDVRKENHPRWGKTHTKESMNKMIITSRNDIVDGKNLLERKARKGVNTLGKEGLLEKAKKSSITMKETLIDDKSLDKIRLEKSHNTMRLKTSEEKEIIRQKISNTLKNKPKLECPHCKKIGAISGMKRWHFENCKERKENG